MRLGLPGLLTVALREVLHELGQRLGAFHRHGVVKRRPQAPDRAVALEVLEALGLGLLDEEVGQSPFGKRKDHVHAAAVARGDGVDVKALGIVDRLVDERRPGAGALVHHLKAAFVDDPLAHEIRNPDIFVLWE